MRFGTSRSSASARRAPRVASSAGEAAHAGGLIVASHRRHFLVRQDDGETVECVLKGRRTVLACGDRVHFARVRGGGAIESVAPRSTLFYRSDAFKEKLIAANVDQVIGVVAPDLAIDEELVNRWIVAAEAEGCRFVLAANKSDKPGFDALLARLAAYSALGYAVVPMSAKRDSAPLLPWLAGRHTVLIGQSGMGKSTILNAVAPHAGAKTAEISQALAAGRHTTTHSTLYPLPATLGNGWIVDSPGMKVFGLAHLAPETIVHAFVDVRPLLGRCRFRDCRHDREPGCAVQNAVADGKLAPHRLALLRTLMQERESARVAGR